mmetsp:Transcript_7076/g.14458  ORF Transcript_7076/g.14458 Transcript_7076/m.14458 type:complete len:280 (-) Transcript_7076:1281-2120(-)
MVPGNDLREAPENLENVGQHRLVIQSGRSARRGGSKIDRQALSSPGNLDEQRPWPRAVCAAPAGARVRVCRQGVPHRPPESQLGSHLVVLLPRVTAVARNQPPALVSFGSDVSRLLPVVGDPNIVACLPRRGTSGTGTGAAAGTSIVVVVVVVIARTSGAIDGRFGDRTKLGLVQSFYEQERGVKSVRKGKERQFVCTIDPFLRKKNKNSTNGNWKRRLVAISGSCPGTSHRPKLGRVRSFCDQKVGIESESVRGKKRRLIARNPSIHKKKKEKKKARK